MSQESKTPRADAAAVFRKDEFGDWVETVNADFARHLERELAAVTEERDALIASARIKEANSGWRPIETAPRDGSDVLTWWDGKRRIAWSYDRKGPWLTAGDAWNMDCAEYTQPTHWMPLPAPPTTEPDQ